MTQLATTYARLIRPSLVAFIYKFYDAHATGGTRPPFPTIIGTGFVVDSEGWIATNRHVADAFLDVPDEVRAASGNVPPVMAMLFQLVDGDLHTPAFQVEQVHALQAPTEALTPFAQESPDLALVRINVRGLSALEVAQGPVIQEGLELASAGFPMGTEALTAAGYLTQLSPTLQRGIVSAVLPWPGTHPHAFLLNIMVRGGASGSPVFFPESGEVAGIVYAGLLDRESCNAISYVVPTNLTYVLPAHVVSTTIDVLRSSGFLVPQPGAPTLADRMAEEPTGENGALPWEPLPGQDPASED